MLESKMKWKLADIQHNMPNGNLNEFSPLIQELLIQRGITSHEEADAFLSPELAHLYTAGNLSDIDRAAERVHRGIADGDKILVFGDYDADGVSSTTLMMQTLQALGADCDYYIPNRFTEGYGPNEDAFKMAHKEGYQVIITVDTGIASVHEADVAKQLGIDLIITDHHEVQTELPDAYAIIHPKCSPDYTFKELAGVGVAFKFTEKLLGYFPEEFLDLAAIGTVADLVPLTSENRIITYYGLSALSSTTRPGLNALKKVCGIQGNVSEEDIGFLIGPRLNAVGRLQDADLAVQLLMTDDPAEAAEIAEMVQDINQERQQIVSDIVKEAEQMTDTISDKGVIVVAKEGWNQGVLGIVASSLVRKYDRPAIVLTILPEQGVVKGSARSIPAFDLFEGCMQISDVFTQFGGHAQAAGMTLPIDNLQPLQTKLDRIIHQQLSAEDFTQEVEIAKTITVPEVNEELVDEIRHLAPFGMANPKPVFHLKHVPSDVKQIGSHKKHLKMQFRQDQTTLDGIGFGCGDLYYHISPQTELSVIGELNINEWNGFRKVQIVIQDMKIDDRQLFDHRGKDMIDMAAYVRQETGHLAVYETLPEVNDMPDNVLSVTYDTDISSMRAIHTLYLFEMPSELNRLQDMVKQLSPLNIHVCFQLKDSAYMKTFPTREDFKWLYALLNKRQQLDLKKEMPMLMDAKAWTKERLKFMFNVFFDLGFAKIENNVIELNANVSKKDLSDSKTYQRHVNMADVEKTLYYSTYNELKSWFFNSIEDSREKPKEELSYGF